VYDAVTDGGNNSVPEPPKRARFRQVMESDHGLVGDDLLSAIAAAVPLNGLFYGHPRRVSTKSRVSPRPFTIW
jgi:hypothetical protein